MDENLHLVCPDCDAVNRVPKTRLVAGEGGKCGRCHQPLFRGQPIALSGDRFAKHVASSDVPVVVDFWAAWCGPCRALAPVFEKTAAALEPQARFVKLDVDADPETANRYGVQSIPALFVFRRNQVLGRQAGLMDEASLRRWVGQFAS